MPRTEVALFYHMPSVKKLPHGTVRHFCITQGLIKYKNISIIDNLTRKLQEKIELHNACNLQNPPYAMFTISMCSIPPWQCCQSPNVGPPFMPASIYSTLQYKLPQKNENDYNELFI
jgi:hypothetical protein